MSLRCLNITIPRCISMFEQLRCVYMQVQLDPSPQPTGHVEQMAVRGSDATSWIEKFMSTAFQEKDPELMGHNNDMTPLALVAAARWRKTLNDVQHEQETLQEAAAAAETARLQEEKARTEGQLCFLNGHTRYKCNYSFFGELEGTPGYKGF